MYFKLSDFHFTNFSIRYIDTVSVFYKEGEAYYLQMLELTAFLENHVYVLKYFEVAPIMYRSVKANEAGLTGKKRYSKRSNSKHVLKTVRKLASNIYRTYTTNEAGPNMYPRVRAKEAGPNLYPRIKANEAAPNMYQRVTANEAGPSMYQNFRANEAALNMYRRVRARQAGPNRAAYNMYRR